MIPVVHLFLMKVSVTFYGVYLQSYIPVSSEGTNYPNSPYVLPELYNLAGFSGFTCQEIIVSSKVRTFEMSYL